MHIARASAYRHGLRIRSSGSAPCAWTHASARSTNAEFALAKVQNIVIGGASGALPPMIGWASVTGDIALQSVLLFAIIFVWTPPHFWALALFCSDDYEKAGVPMMPVVLGVRETKKQMLIYTVLLVPITIAPVAIGMTGIAAGAAIGVLGLWFLWHAVKVWRQDGTKPARAMFRFSIVYLFLVFALLLGDRAIRALI